MADILLLHVPRQLVASLMQRVAQRRRRSALHRAFKAAYKSFAKQHEEWAASFFDDHFLALYVTPLLLEAWESRRHLTPAQLAAAWRAQFPPNYTIDDRLRVEAIHMAAIFLALLQAELDADPSLAAFRISTEPYA